MKKRRSETKKEKEGENGGKKFDRKKRKSKALESPRGFRFNGIFLS